MIELKRGDVPQSRLLHIRRVVDAVAKGRKTVERVAAAARMEGRAAQYHLRAAESLGLITKKDRAYRTTRLGERLHATVRDSAEEREAFADAVRGSAKLGVIAPGLIARDAPTREALARNLVQVAKLGWKTADRRAADLLKWRREILDENPSLPYGEPATGPGVAAVREEVVEALQPVEALMLSSIRLHDFKSFADQTIPLAPLTLLVGANASGKSNLLDAIRFLQGLALDYPVADVLRDRYEGGRLVWPAIRGGVAEVARKGREEFEIETRWKLAQAVCHRVGVTMKGTPMLSRESLVAEGYGPYLFDSHARSLTKSAGLQPGGALNVAYKSTGGGRNETRAVAAARSAIGQLDPGGRLDPVVLEIAHQVQRAARAAVFLSIEPGKMREYAPRQLTELGATGANVSAVVHEMCQTEDGKRRLVDWLSELCAPTIADIDFVETELGDVMLQLVEADGTRISARSLSDGTLRFLGEIVALLTAEKGSLLLVEEIENGLHPERVHLLVQLLEAVTVERGVQVIATTHSPRVLAALSTEGLHAAVLFARVEGEPGTITRRLGDLPKLDEVVARRGIDDLFSTGWLERAL